MNLLCDTCIARKAIEALRSNGHNVVWSAERPEDPGDEALLAEAWSGKRVLVTADKDFGELAVVRGRSHVGIIRLVELGASEQAPMIEGALARYANDLSSGAIITVTRTRTRVRLNPLM